MIIHICEKIYHQCLIRPGKITNLMQNDHRQDPN